MGGSSLHTPTALVTHHPNPERPPELDLIRYPSFLLFFWAGAGGNDVELMVFDYGLEIH